MFVKTSLPLAGLLTVAFTFAMSSVAHAYIPPSFFVVRALTRKHAVVEEGRFKHKVSFYKGDGELVRSFNEMLVLTDPHNVIVRLTDETGKEVATHTRSLTGARTQELSRPVLYDLLLMSDGATVFTHFKHLGLPLKTEADLYSEKEGALPYKPESYVGLARYENRIAVVVGDTAKRSVTDVKTPQLWVEKDSFLPLRAVFPSAPESGIASEPLEFKFSGYQTYKGLLYPRVTQILRRGKLWVKLETQDVQLGAGIKPESSQARADLDGDVKDFTEMYFKWVR